VNLKARVSTLLGGLVSSQKKANDLDGEKHKPCHPRLSLIWKRKTRHWAYLNYYIQL